MLVILFDCYCRKKFGFFVDANPLICVLSHILVLAYDDEAFRVSGVTPDRVLRLSVRSGSNNLPIQWKPEILPQPVFRAPNNTRRREGKTGRQGLNYDTYNTWLKRLGAETGFSEVLRSYCLRRGNGNAINGRCCFIRTDVFFMLTVPQMTPIARLLFGI